MATTPPLLSSTTTRFIVVMVMTTTIAPHRRSDSNATISGRGLDGSLLLARSSVNSEDGSRCTRLFPGDPPCVGWHRLLATASFPGDPGGASPSSDEQLSPFAAIPVR
ncbi:hypothetical protein M6B38_407660 [Iris pallida]|uniref:Secreted protein n=1 Tax=Iris pallida TaxID=29817 RepID=A0AAX6FQF7_IRIPA|nr:hypothetical protein M6B38_407660 [Iris pallida]